MSERERSKQEAEWQARPPGGTPEPPFQAVLPNFDKMSRDSFAKGTVSRRRIVTAALLFLGLLAVMAGAILLSVLL